MNPLKHKNIYRFHYSYGQFLGISCHTATLIDWLSAIDIFSSNSTDKIMTQTWSFLSEQEDTTVRKSAHYGKRDAKFLMLKDTPLKTWT